MIGVLALASGCSVLVDLDRFQVAPGEDAGVPPGTDGAVSMDAGDAGELPDGEVPEDASADAGPPPDPPDTPLLRFPWNGYMTGSALTSGQPAGRNAMRPRFRWEESPRAERYEVQLSATCDTVARSTCPFGDEIAGTSPVTDWRPDAPLSVATTAPIGRRYFWRVRACNRGGCSEWSEVRFVDVGRQVNDFDGDGFADLLVGSVSRDELVRFRGPTLTSSETVVHPAVVGAFGRITVTAGDLTGDGRSDALVGAYEDTADSHAGAGRVVLLDRGVGPTFAAEFTSPNAEADGSYGAALAAGCDIDGNGILDFVVGAPFETVGAQPRAGRAYVYLLSASDRTPRPIVLESPSPEMDGEYGWAVSCSGDLDADGFSDVAVSGFREGASGILRAGRVHVYAGGPTGVATTPGTTVVSPFGDQGSAFAGTVTTGDVDGDGIADLLVGAIGEMTGDVRGGAVYFVRGGRAGFSAPVRWVASTPVANAFFGSDHVIVEAEARGVVVGAALQDATAGQAFLVRPDGSSTLIDRTVGTPAAFGASMSAVGDAPGDGSTWVAIGVLLDEGVAGMPGSGGVRIYDWTPSGAIPSFQLVSPAPETDGQFGAVAGTRAGLHYR